MSEYISEQPRLFTGNKEDFEADSEAAARVHRLVSLEGRIFRRPEVYQKAFTDLGPEATAETLDIHADEVETRDAVVDPKKIIKEYFAKRDDQEILFDPASDDAIFGSEQFKELSAEARKKTATSMKSGRDTVRRDHPEAREASNAVRRHILGEFIGRVVTYEAQQSSKKVNRAG